MDRDFAIAVAQLHRFALFDVTKSRAGPRRFDADRYQRASLFRCCGRCVHRRLKRRAISDNVISRQRKHRRGVVPGRDPTGAECNRCRRVAFGWFGHDVFFWKFLKHVTNGRFLFDICQDENALARNETLQSRHGFLEQRSFGNET